MKRDDRTALVRECKAMRKGRRCMRECSFWHTHVKGLPAFCKGAQYNTGRR